MRPNIQRNYGIFQAMAGVRPCNENLKSFEPKGVPEDMNMLTASEYKIYIADDDTPTERGCVSRKKAEQWVKEGRSTWIRDRSISHPDWHTPSWLSFQELKEAYQRYSVVFTDVPEPSILATIAYMQVFENIGISTRIVFWFDN